MTSHIRPPRRIEPDASDFEHIGSIFRRMADKAGLNPTFRRALREARDLHDVAEAFVDGQAQEYVEGKQ